MSAFAAGGGFGGEMHLLRTNSDELSELGDSQPLVFDDAGNVLYAPAAPAAPIFTFYPQNMVILKDNIQVTSGNIVSEEFVEDAMASGFATHVNEIVNEFHQNVLQAIEEHNIEDNSEYQSEEDDLTELSTGLIKTINIDEIRGLNEIIGEYDSNIAIVINNTFDSPDLSVFSQGSARTQNSASTQSAISVLTQLRQPQIITQIVNNAIETKNATSKKKIASEVVDLTVGGCDHTQLTIEDTLKHNNRFGILKFCSANRIPISGQFGNPFTEEYIPIKDPLTGEPIEMNNETDKIYYSIKELEWMLEQGTSAKGGTRKLRFEALLYCLQHPLAIRLFNKIYEMLYATLPGTFIKICAVGGNVLRAFFLALRFARNIFNNVTNEEPDDRCTALDDLSPEEIVELGRFANTIPALDELCEKKSDTDLTGIKQLSKEEYDSCQEKMKIVLHLLCLHKELRVAKYIELSQKEPKTELICTGKVEFALIRLKAVTYEDGSHYEEKCGSIANNTETMKVANYYFSDIKWFAQMIPDDDVNKYLDELSIRKGYLNDNVTHKTNPDGTYTDKTFAKFYPEIKKLYCTIQEVKKHNAVMTSVNSYEISLDSFKHLIEFTQSCCQILFDAIGPHVEVDDFKDISTIVDKITPYASRAMFSLLENPIIEPYIIRVLEHLNNTIDLASPEFLEEYETNVHILTDETGNPVPVKSTCIAVSNQDNSVSSKHKACSAEIRHSFSEFYKSYPSHKFNQNLSMTINCLVFEDPNGAIEDLKEAGEQHANIASIEFKEPYSSSHKYKYEKPPASQQKTTIQNLKKPELEKLIYMMKGNSNFHKKVLKLKSETKSKSKSKSKSDPIKFIDLFKEDTHAIRSKYQNVKSYKEILSQLIHDIKISEFITKFLESIDSEKKSMGGAKTRKRKPRKTRKRGKPKHRTTRVIRR